MIGAGLALIGGGLGIGRIGGNAVEATARQPEMAGRIFINMILTAVPVVEYGPEHIWGGDGMFNGRFFTIPLEDFFYNISMLTWYLLAYLLIKRCIASRKGMQKEE